MPKRNKEKQKNKVEEEKGQIWFMVEGKAAECVAKNGGEPLLMTKAQLEKLFTYFYLHVV